MMSKGTIQGGIKRSIRRGVPGAIMAKAVGVTEKNLL
jgi:hypothetical protein